MDRINLAEDTDLWRGGGVLVNTVMNFRVP
jgi:hypothetical protein